MRMSRPSEGFDDEMTMRGWRWRWMRKKRRKKRPERGRGMRRGMRWVVAGRQNRQREKSREEKNEVEVEVQVQVEEEEEKANRGGGRWAWEWTWTAAAGSAAVVVVGLATGEGSSQWQTDLQETERPADAYQSLSWTGRGTGSADGETQLAGSAVWVVVSVGMLAEVLMLEEEVVATSKRRDSRGSGIRGCPAGSCYYCYSAPGEADSGSAAGRDSTGCWRQLVGAVVAGEREKDMISPLTMAGLRWLVWRSRLVLLPD